MPNHPKHVVQMDAALRQAYPGWEHVDGADLDSPRYADLLRLLDFACRGRQVVHLVMRRTYSTPSRAARAEVLRNYAEQHAKLTEKTKHLIESGVQAAALLKGIDDPVDVPSEDQLEVVVLTDRTWIFGCLRDNSDASTTIRARSSLRRADLSTRNGEVEVTLTFSGEPDSWDLTGTTTRFEGDDVEMLAKYAVDDLAAR